MVEQVTINPTEVRGYGNICEGHTLEDFIVSNSGLAKEKEDVHGALTEVYKLVYSVYGLMFDFDKGNKQLYLQTAEADTLSFGFDEDSKQLYLVDENDTGFNLGFDEDTNELYITDDAPPIVHNYSLALDQSSYTTTGSLSVSATLLDDGVAVEGATVSFTGGDSAVTATTNSSGVATATVTFSASGTLTASYSNVSDTATVTVQSYLFYDACDSASGLSDYGSPISLGSNSTATLSYDSTMNAYKLTSNSSDNKFVPITALNGLTELKLTMEWYQPSASNRGSTAVEPVVGTTTKAGLCYTFFNDNNGFVRQRYSGGSWRGNDTIANGIAYRDEWLKIELTIEDTSVTMKAYRMNSDTPFATDTYTLTNISTDYNTASNRRYGLGIGYANNSYGYFRNIKAEAL